MIIGFKLAVWIIFTMTFIFTASFFSHELNRSKAEDEGKLLLYLFGSISAAILFGLTGLGYFIQSFVIWVNT